MKTKARHCPACEECHQRELYHDRCPGIAPPPAVDTRRKGICMDVECMDDSEHTAHGRTPPAVDVEKWLKT